MSNLYTTEPITTGKVVVESSLGDIEIELFCKEAPKACRNFLGLCMEGYYDGVIFHRIVPGFICQTGDPTGTGMGGESFFGEPFENEVHPRLRFNRRGLIAMANNGDKHSNTSQWFITLDRTDELQQKHTLFGKITGPTIYNVLKMANLSLDKNEKPLDPPVIRTIRIIESPFEDLVPRITRAEKLAQQEARLEAAKEREQRELRKKAKKNTGLLSFGEEADAESSEAAEGVKRKNMARADLINPDDAGPSQQYIPLPASLAGVGKSRPEAERQGKSANEVEDISAIRRSATEAKSAEAAQKQAAIERMQAKLRALDKRRTAAGGGGDGESEDDDDDDAEDAGGSSKKRRTGPSYLEQELAKYAAGRKGKRKGGKRDEDDVMAALSSFTGKLKRRADEDDDVDEQRGGGADGSLGKRTDVGLYLDDREDVEGIEVDDDVDFLKHALRAETEPDMSESRRAESDYTVIDPRAKAKALREERKGGGDRDRGNRWGSSRR